MRPSAYSMLSEPGLRSRIASARAIKGSASATRGRELGREADPLALPLAPSHTLAPIARGHWEWPDHRDRVASRRFSRREPCPFRSDARPRLKEYSTMR